MTSNPLNPQTTRLQPLNPLAEANIPLNLIESLRRGEALAMVGSGLSIPLGFPSWDTLIEKLYRQVESTVWPKDEKTHEWVKKNLNTQPDWVAEVLRSTARDSFDQELRQVFRVSGLLPFSMAHAFIALLPFKGYITTNYDTLIEDHLSIFDWEDPNVLDYEEACSNISSLSVAKRYILKLHGCARKRPDKIILTSSDYYNLMHDERYIRLLAWLISQHTMLTVGFSLRDKDFRSFIEERYHLYGVHCPPIYAVVGDNETCELEITTLHKYNIHLVPISEADDFSALTSLLFSLYCLIYRVDSSVIGADIENLVKNRIISSGKFQVPSPGPMSPSAERASQLLSVFQEPVDISVFTTLCMDAGLDLSPAHYRIIGSATADSRVGIKIRSIFSEADRSFVARWLKSALEAIPMGGAPRYLSTYHKSFFDRYAETLRELLSSSEGWKELVGEDEKALLRLTRINEYFRQEGRWGQWLEIAEKAQLFVMPSSSLFIPLMRTKLWVYFWTRRYAEARQLANQYPEVDERQGESSYTERLMYMIPGKLPELIEKLSNIQNRDYFNESLLGRACARLSLSQSNHEQRQALLMTAKEHLAVALAGAKTSKDQIETAVQSWYLACVLADLGEIDQANLHLGETRRLDECIMKRVPGIAWLRMAEYRLVANDPAVSPSTKNSYKETAMSAMQQLGMANVEEFVDKEYYY